MYDILSSLFKILQIPFFSVGNCCITQFILSSLQFPCRLFKLVMYRSNPSKVYCEREYDTANYTTEWMTTYCTGEVQQSGLKQNGVVHNPIGHFTVTLSRSPELYCFNDFISTLTDSATRFFISSECHQTDTHLSIYPPVVTFSCAYITGSCYTTTTFSYFSSHSLPLSFTRMKRSKLNPFQSGDSFCQNSSVKLIIQWLIHLNTKQSKFLEQNES